MKKFKQGQTRYMLHYYSPQHTESGCFMLMVSPVRITKRETVMSATGVPFTCLSVNIVEVGHYFYGESVLNRRTYSNKRAPIKKAQWLVENINWMQENGYTEQEICKWLDSNIYKESK